MLRSNWILGQISSRYFVEVNRLIWPHHYALIGLILSNYKIFKPQFVMLSLNIAVHVEICSTVFFKT